MSDLRQWMSAEREAELRNMVERRGRLDHGAEGVSVQVGWHYVAELLPIIDSLLARAGEGEET